MGRSGSDEQFGYEGEAGRTRLEPVHIEAPDGSLRSISVYRAVNVGTNPRLRAPALSGELHLLEDGTSLAVPFVYHDPSARKLALVVPGPLRYRVLQERAAFFERLAADTASPVPPYAAEGRVVVGLAALRAYLDERSALLTMEANGSALEVRASELARQADELARREARLQARAEKVTAQEDDLRMLRERLEREREALGDPRSPDAGGNGTATRRARGDGAYEEAMAGLVAVGVVADGTVTDDSGAHALDDTGDDGTDPRVTRAADADELEPLIVGSRAARGVEAGSLERGVVDRRAEADEARFEGSTFDEEVLDGEGVLLVGAVPAQGDDDDPEVEEIDELRTMGEDVQSLDDEVYSLEDVLADAEALASASFAELDDDELEEDDLDEAALEDDLEGDIEDDIADDEIDPDVDVLSGSGEIFAAGVVQLADDPHADDFADDEGIEDVSELVEELPGASADVGSGAEAARSGSIESEERAKDPASAAGTTGAASAGSDAEDEEVASGERPRSHRTAEGERVAPEALADAERQMVAVVEATGVRLSAQIDEGHEDAFDGEADLLVQYMVVDDVPVVLLSLVEESSGRPYARRAALNPRAPDDRAALDRLRERFSATVDVYGRDGRLLRSFALEGPRSVNVALVLERADRAQGKRIDAATALERALAAPPPLRAAGHPFVTSEPATEASEAALRLARLLKWSSPERVDMATLALSIPRTAIDDAFHRILDDAVRHGIAVPASLVPRAVSLGVAREPGELVLQSIDGFRGTTKLPNQGGLGGAAIADNWERLLSLASEHEVAIDPETHDVAHEAIRSVRGRSSAPAHVAPDALPGLSVADLVPLLDHPKVRRAAALELIDRDDDQVLVPLFKAIRKMPRDEVVGVVPRLLAFGERVGDVLIEGLAAKKTFVRQAAALTLGELRLRRAVVPLVHLLQEEPSDIWQEVARVLGELGTPVLRPLLRAMQDPRGQEARFAYALAHVAEAGGESQWSRLREDTNPVTAAIVQQAVTQRDVVRGHTRMARGEEEIDPDDIIRAFSRRFYDELTALGRP